MPNSLKNTNLPVLSFSFSLANLQSANEKCLFFWSSKYGTIFIRLLFLCWLISDYEDTQPYINTFLFLVCPWKSQKSNTWLS